MGNSQPNMTTTCNYICLNESLLNDPCWSPVIGDSYKDTHSFEHSKLYSLSTCKTYNDYITLYPQNSGIQLKKNMLIIIIILITITLLF